MFSQLQLILAGVIIASIGGIYYFFHVQPMNELENDKKLLEAHIVVQDNMIAEVGSKMNDAYSLLYSCEDNLTVQYNQGYLDAIGGSSDETNVDVTLDNLHT